MNDFLWWYGLAWLLLTSFLGIMWVIDQGVEWVVQSFHLKRTFLQWYAEKLKKGEAK